MAHSHDTSEDKIDTVKEEPTQELLCPLCQDSFRERAALEKARNANTFSECGWSAKAISSR